jgi:ATP-binding cassette subfamily B protein
MSDTPPTINAGPKATARDVLRAFWEGLRPFAWPFFFVILGIIVAQTVQVFVPLYYKNFFDTLSTASDRNATYPILLNIILHVLLLNGIFWLCNRFSGIIQNVYQAKVMARLRQNAFSYMIKHSYTFFANNFTGSLTQRVNRFARAFDVLADRFIWSVVPIVVSVTGMLIVLSRIQPFIPFIILVWVGFLVLFNYLFSLWKVRFDIRSAAFDSQTTAVLSDGITNQNTVQLFSGHRQEIAYFKKTTNDQARAASLSWNLSAILDAVQGGLIIIAEFVFFYVSLHYWRAGVFTLGTFILIQTYVIGLGSKLWELSRIVRNVYEGFADAKEMVDIMLLPHEIKDVPGAKKLGVSEGKIEFKDLAFSFNKTRTVLDHISLTLNPGEKVALIGPSGAGKTTFVRLVLRLYEATSGAILIDGQNIQHVTQESLRSYVSLVPQEPILFHRSLKENIRYGRKDATDKEVYQAAKLAHCDEFIKDLPLGYDTLVGERGIKLSGGERQRVAIARAILKNAPILILDEATSSLDSESEHYIQDALDTLMKGKTVIVIAHRLSTIRKMDRIIVLDNGKITEQGTHQELLENEHSLYRKLWNLQAGGFLKDVDTAE